MSIRAMAGLVALGFAIFPAVGGAQSLPPPTSMSVRGTVPARPTDAGATATAPAGPNTERAQASAGSGAVSTSSAASGVREVALGATPNAAPAVKPVLKGLGPGGITAAAKKLSPAMMRALGEFEVAKGAFTDFCQQWHQKLVERQVNNSNHINWKTHGGVATGTYVAYGPIESCTCKQAENGVPVGELTYKEMDYTLTGTTIDEAKRAKPAVSVVPTREIFSWDKGKWFY